MTQPDRHTADTITSDALDQLYAEVDELRTTAVQQLDRADRLTGVLSTVLDQFVHKGHPGESCLRTGWVRVSAVDRWRKALRWTEISVQCPDCDGLVPASGLTLHQEAEQRARAERAEAAIERVRAFADLLDHLSNITASAPDRSLYRCVATDLRARLDEQQEQPARPAPAHIGNRANAENCPACSGTNPPYPFICPGP